MPAKKKTAIEMPSTEEVERLFRAIEERWDLQKNPRVRSVARGERKFHRIRDKVIFTGLVETGMRPCEMCSLTLSDYQPTKGQVRIRTSKTHQFRYVPITSSWIELVSEWLKIRPNLGNSTPVSPECDWLFMTTYGDPLTTNGLGKTLRDYRNFAGMAGWTLYGLRHYTITQLVKTGDIAGTAAIAGHSDWRTTQGYNHNDADHVRGVHAAADPLGTIMRHKRGKEAVAAKEKRKKLV